jgi:hypothetical protein
MKSRISMSLTLLGALALSSPAQAQTLSSLTEYQAGLYAVCSAVSDAGFLGVVKKPNLTADLTKLSNEGQIQSLPVLANLTPVQLGCLGMEVLKDYTVQTYPPIPVPGFLPCPAEPPNTPPPGGSCGSPNPTTGLEVCFCANGEPVGYPGVFTRNSRKTTLVLTSFLGQGTSGCLNIAAAYTVSVSAPELNVGRAPT